MVIVASADPNRNVEVETARYYLPGGCAVIAQCERRRLSVSVRSMPAKFILPSARGGPSSPVPQSLGPYQFRESRRYPGLIVYRGTR